MADNILFKGIKQVTKKWFDENSGTTENIKNYLVLVRNRIEDGGNGETSIYFGSRKYADSDALEELKRFIGDKPADIGEKTLIQYFIDKIGTGGGGGAVDLKVEDVTVNGQSVVADKIAKITLPTVDGDDIEQDIQ